jgi:hypothetical protein
MLKRTNVDANRTAAFSLQPSAFDEEHEALGGVGRDRLRGRNAPLPTGTSEAWSQIAPPRAAAVPYLRLWL